MKRTWLLLVFSLAVIVFGMSATITSHSNLGLSDMQRSQKVLGIEEIDNFPGNDLLDEMPISIEDTNIGGTFEVDEPNPLGGYNSVWYDWTSPIDGTIYINTCDTDFDTMVVVYTGDEFSSMSSVADGDEGCDVGNGSTLQFEATYDEVYRIQIMSYAENETGNYVLFLDENSSLTPTPLDTPIETPTDTPTDTPAVLPDNFVDAEVLYLGDSIFLDSLSSATTEVGEPLLVQGKYNATNSIWYTYNPVSTTDVIIDTCDYHTEAMLSVFTGNEIGSLDKVVDNNYGCANSEGARIFFNAQVGTSYKIQLSIYDNRSSGSILLNLNENFDASPTPPINDDFTSSIALTIDERLPVTNEYSRYEYNSTFGASIEPGEPNNGGIYQRSIWYHWTNDATTREVWVDTCAYGGIHGDAEADTVLGIYTGSSIGAMSLVVENDDWDNPYNPNWTCNWDSITSFVSFTAQPNETYHIRIVELSDKDMTSLITLRTKPTVIETSVDIPGGGLWCTNHGGIARKIPYRIAENDWAACWSWCNANMTSDMQICQMNGDGGRNCWLNFEPSGGMDNCNWADGVYGPDTWPKGSYWGEITGYIMDLPVDLSGRLLTNENINVGINRQNGDRTIMLKEANNGARITDILAHFVQNLDWTSVDGSSDLLLGKAFMHNITSAPQADTSYSLYVPIPADKESTKVVVCPGVDSTEEISRNCPGAQIKIVGDTNTEIVTINGQSYWKLDNMVSTGGYSFTTTGLQIDLPSTTAYTGTPIDFTLKALDSNSQVDAGYFGTAEFTTLAPNSIVPNDYTFVDVDSGAHTLSATFNEAGIYSITATDTLDTELTTTSVQIEVLAATPTPVPTITETPIPTATVTEIITPTATIEPTGSITPTIIDDIVFTKTPTITPTITQALTPTPSITPPIIPMTLEISNVQITQIVNGVQICWDTNLPSSGLIKYGINPDEFIIDTAIEEEENLKHCQALTLKMSLADYYYEIIVIANDGQQADYVGAFSIIPILDELPPTGENSCRIDPPQISGDTTNGYIINFSTDNNEDVECGFLLGGEFDKIDLNPYLINAKDGYFSVKILASRLPKVDEIKYQLVCRSAVKECSFSSNIKLVWPVDKGENVLALLLGPSADMITTPLGILAVSTEAKTAAVGVVGLAATTFLLSNPQLFWVGLIWVYRKPKKQRFGLVYDENTKQVIPFAVVRLLDSITKRVVTQTVADLQGRYHLLATSGDFVFEVNQDTYEKYSTPLTLVDKDLQITINVALNKTNLIPSKKFQIRRTIQVLNKYIFAFGFVFSLLMLLLNFYLVNLIIIGIYIIQMIVLVLQKPPRNWGRVVESSTGKALKGAFISILDTVEQRQVDMQISDFNGRFGIILEKQSYLLKINMSGYKLKKINKDWQSLLLPGGDIAYMLPKEGVENLDVEMESLSL